MSKRILQITIPAQPTWAVFGYGDDRFSFPEIHMWALVEDDHGNRTIEGVYEGEGLEFAGDNKAFCHYTTDAELMAGAKGLVSR